MKKAETKQAQPSTAACRVCGEPRQGKGGRGLCSRCYFREWRGKKPSAEPLKREPGTWTRISAHVDAALADQMQAAAKEASQTPPRWLEDAIREKLERKK